MIVARSCCLLSFPHHLGCRGERVWHLRAVSANLGVCAHLTPCPVLNLGIHLFLSLCVWLRTKRTLGLGSLYGENDLLELDGDPLHERQVAEKQLAALGDIL